MNTFSKPTAIVIGGGIVNSIQERQLRGLAVKARDGQSMNLKACADDEMCSERIGYTVGQFAEGDRVLAIWYTPQRFSSVRSNGGGGNVYSFDSDKRVYLQKSTGKAGNLLPGRKRKPR